MTVKTIISDIKKGEVSPIYLLMGEEPFFIDQISDAFERYLIPEEMKGFNESVYYGLDTDVNQLIGMAKSFPMMGDKQLIVVKEAQSLKNIQDLASYCAQPTPSTVLVLCHKYKKVDKRSQLYKTVASNGVAFLSETIRDYKIAPWIAQHAKSISLNLNEKQCALLGEYMGTDLAHIDSELGKLKIASKGEVITDEMIQRNIGISKSYNVFELQLAVLSRDFNTALKITDHFTKNPKAMHIIGAIGSLYNVFTRMIKLSYAKDKSKNASSSVGISFYMHPKYMQGIQKYSLKKMVYNISVLKEYDLKAKGVDSSGSDDEGLFIEMMQKIIL